MDPHHIHTYIQFNVLDQCDKLPGEEIDDDECFLDGSNLGKTYKYNPIISFPSPDAM